MASGISVRLVLPSEIRLVDLVHQAAEKMAEVAGCGEDDALNLGLAVREAVINAIVHGNRQDARRKIHVTLTSRRRAIEARVRDQGDGFDPQGVPDPTLEANRLRTSGRGLLLIRAFVDELSFRRRKNGLEVRLTKRIATVSDGPQ
jgi:serine/threonine-protein kinase RsbW